MSPFRTEDLCSAFDVLDEVLLRWRRRGLISDTSYGQGSRCRFTLDDARRVVLVRQMPDFEHYANGGGRHPNYPRCRVILDCATNHSWRGWVVATPDGEVSWADTAEAAVALRATSGVTTIIPLAAIAAEADQAMREAA